MYYLFIISYCMKNTKLTSTAKEWIENEVRFCFTDCHDSMREMEKIEERFLGYTNDKISVDKFVKDNLIEEYAIEVKQNMEEQDYSFDDLNSLVCDLSIEPEYIKKYL